MASARPTTLTASDLVAAFDEIYFGGGLLRSNNGLTVDE